MHLGTSLFKAPKSPKFIDIMDDLIAQKVTSVIREASQRFILPRFKALKSSEIETKTNPTDLVTMADIEAEAFFEVVLPQLLPGSIVLGEEGASRGEHDLSLLTPEAGQRAWVVDPVDGTYNFVHGRGDFGVMVCLVENGVCVASWIYDVLRDSMAHALRGQGAYIDGEPLTTPQDDLPFEQMIVHLSPKFFPPDIKQAMKTKAAAMPNVKTVGSAAHEYLKVARGVSDAAVYCRLKPWDHLPGALIVQEAGGVITKWNGQEYTPQDRYDGLIVARTRRGWQNVYDAFFGDMDLDAYMKARWEMLRKQGKV